MNRSGTWLLVATLFATWATAMYLVCGASLWAPISLAPGAGWSEAPNHLWTLAMATESLGSTGPFHFQTMAVNFPDGVSQHLMDPVNLLWFAPLYRAAGGGAAGAALGYKGVVAANLLLAIVGGYRAGKHFSGSSMGGLVASVGLVMSASLLSLFSFGFTELMPIGWLALHYEAMDQVLSGQRKRIPWASSTLAALALSGAYMALMGAMCAFMWGLASLLARPPSDGRLRGFRSTLLVWSIAAVLSVPNIASIYGDREHLLQARPDLPVPVAELRPSDLRRGLDLRDLLPLESRGALARSAGVGGAGDTSPQEPHRAWPGLLLSGLALVGVCGFPRKTLPLLLLLLLTASMLPGPFAYLDGRLIQLSGRAVSLPPYWICWILPFARMVSDWGKFAVFASLHLAMLGAFGSVVLSRILRRLAIPGPMGLLLHGLLLMLLCWETLLPARFARQPPVFSLEPPDGLLAVLEELPHGPVLQLPLDNSHRESRASPAYAYCLWQLSHRRPISENDVGPDAVLFKLPWLAGLQSTEPGIRPHGRAAIPTNWEPVSDGDKPWNQVGDVGRQMEELGFTAMVLDRKRALSPEKWVQSLEHRLGPATVVSGAFMGWAL